MAARVGHSCLWRSQGIPLRALVSALFLVSIVAMAETTSTPERRDKAVIGMLWWAYSDALYPGRDYEVCLTKAIVDRLPGVMIVSQERLRRSLFPLLEPSVQPSTPEIFEDLLERKDVRARLEGLELTHIISINAVTSFDEGHGFISCSYGCLGYAWSDEHTQMNVTVWNLQQLGGSQKKYAVEKEGTNYMPAFLVPIPLFSNTADAACLELAVVIADELS